MQVEAGCPYTRRGCSGDDYEDGDCIGVGSPQGNISAAASGDTFMIREAKIATAAFTGFGLRSMIAGFSFVILNQNTSSIDWYTKINFTE